MWTLLEACDSKDEAYKKLPRYARLIKGSGVAATHGVAVRRVRGEYGIWIIDRRDKDVSPKDRQ